MTFLARLDVVEPFDTWLGMELAATERYWDGLTLAANDLPRNTGSIYCFGYVVEMLLKVTYFRITGVVDTQNLNMGPLAAMRTHVAWSGRNLHDLQGLVSLLIDVRQTLGIAFDPAVVGPILWHVLTVEAHWRESLRYKFTQALEEEMYEVYHSVEWLLTHCDLLWS